MRALGRPVTLCCEVAGPWDKTCLGTVDPYRIEAKGLGGEKVKERLRICTVRECLQATESQRQMEAKQFGLRILPSMFVTLLANNIHTVSAVGRQQQCVCQPVA